MIKASTFAIMASAISDYTKLFTVIQNKPNTVWISRLPDKTRHMLTLRPRYAEEYLGQVRTTANTSDRQIRAEFDQPNLAIGFEVQNQHTGPLLIEIYSGSVKLASHDFKVGEKYFFDKFHGQELIVKRDAESYEIVIRLPRSDTWSSTLGISLDSEIKVPHVAALPDEKHHVWTGKRTSDRSSKGWGAAGWSPGFGGGTPFSWGAGWSSPAAPPTGFGGGWGSPTAPPTGWGTGEGVSFGEPKLSVGGGFSFGGPDVSVSDPYAEAGFRFTLNPVVVAL